MGWVTERHNCTLRMAFDEMHDFVAEDVKEANSLLPENRRSLPFKTVPGNGGLKRRFYVEGFPINGLPEGNKRTITFVLHEDEILIDRSGPETLSKLSNIIVKQKWDFPKSSCVLFVGGEQKSAQEISQLALEPLFFK